MNETIFGMAYKPTAECFNWCKDSIEVYRSNLQITDITLVIIASIALLIGVIIINNSERITSRIDLTEEQLSGIYRLVNHLAFYMLLVFIIWFTFFR